MALSFAECHWKAIERMIKQQMQLARMDPTIHDQNPIKHINDYSIVVQEHFQKRVQFWLDTVEKKAFHIKHHWLCFEFAPSMHTCWWCVTNNSFNLFMT